MRSYLTTRFVLGAWLVIVLMHVRCFGQIRTLNGHQLSPVKLDQFLAGQLTKFGMPSLSIAIINEGKIVYQRAIGVVNTATKISVDNQSIYEAASLSKTVFAYFVLRLVDKGVLTLDTPLYTYMAYPDIATDERYKLITARMVLCHTSGLPNWRTSDFAAANRQIPHGNLYLKFTPGTQFSYSGEGYYYLAQVVAHLTNRSLYNLDSLAQQEVIKPLGLPYGWFSTNPFITRHKVTGYIKGKPIEGWPASLPKQDSTWFGAAGGFHTESVSYAKFLIALMNGEGLTIKSSHTLFSEQVKLPTDGDNDGDTAWGLGIAIQPTPYGRDYVHRGNNGNFQSYFRINKAQKSGYVLFTNCDKGPEFHEALAAFFRNDN